MHDVKCLPFRFASANVGYFFIVCKFFLIFSYLAIQLFTLLLFTVHDSIWRTGFPYGKTFQGTAFAAKRK